MEGVNPFIKNNKHRMIMFLDELGVGYLFPFSLGICGHVAVLFQCLGKTLTCVSFTECP